MMRAVRFDQYGDVESLYVADVARPRPGRGRVLVAVRAAGINPGEAAIRRGVTNAAGDLPVGSGQRPGRNGRRARAGRRGVEPGDEVIGFTHHRSSHAELVVAEAGTSPPAPRRVGGCRCTVRRRDDGLGCGPAGRSAAASRGRLWRGRRRRLPRGPTRPTRRRDRDRTGLRTPPPLAAGHGVTPVTYEDGVADRVRAAANGRVDAFIDTFGSGYVDLALALGVAAERIDTIADCEAAERHGVMTDGNIVGASAEVLAELARVSPSASWKSRSLGSTRSSTSATRTASSSSATRSARSATASSRSIGSGSRHRRQERRPQAVPGGAQGVQRRLAVSGGGDCRSGAGRPGKDPSEVA